MDFKLELVAVPVSDVDRAMAFYVDQAGFNADHDHRVSDEIRFVQLTPPGSACSIALGKGVIDTPPGSVQGLQLVVDDIEAAHKDLSSRGSRSATCRTSRGAASCSSAIPTATAGPYSRSSTPRGRRSRGSRAGAMTGAVRHGARRGHRPRRCPGRRGDVVGRWLTMRPDGRRAALAVGRLAHGRRADGPVRVARELPEDERVDHGGSFLSTGSCGAPASLPAPPTGGMGQTATRRARRRVWRAMPAAPPPTSPAPARPLRTSSQTPMSLPSSLVAGADAFTLRGGSGSW